MLFWEWVPILTGNGWRKSGRPKLQTDRSVGLAIMLSAVSIAVKSIVLGNGKMLMLKQLLVTVGMLKYDARIRPTRFREYRSQPTATRGPNRKNVQSGDVARNSEGGTGFLRQGVLLIQGWRL